MLLCKPICVTRSGFSRVTQSELTTVTYICCLGNGGINAFKNIVKEALPGISNSDDLVVWRATLRRESGENVADDGSKNANHVPSSSDSTLGRGGIVDHWGHGLLFSVHCMKTLGMITTNLTMTSLHLIMASFIHIMTSRVTCLYNSPRSTSLNSRCHQDVTMM